MSLDFWPELWRARLPVNRSLTEQESVLRNGFAETFQSKLRDLL
jgi:hypothetical protein